VHPTAPHKKESLDNEELASQGSLSRDSIEHLDVFIRVNLDEIQ
jgi:hypothetical protein